MLINSLHTDTCCYIQGENEARIVFTHLRNEWLMSTHYSDQVFKKLWFVSANHLYQQSPLTVWGLLTHHRKPVHPIPPLFAINGGILSLSKDDRGMVYLYGQLIDVFSLYTWSTSSGLPCTRKAMGLLG